MEGPPGSAPARPTMVGVDTGLTLLELLAVMVIISILAGLGLGVMGAFTNQLTLQRQTSSLRTLVRSARSAAQRKQQGSMILIEAGGREARAIVREPIAAFQFEQPAFSEISPDDALHPAVAAWPRYQVQGAPQVLAQARQGALFDPGGRYGGGLLLAGAAAHLEMPHTPILETPEGLAFQAWIWAEDPEDAPYPTEEEVAYAEAGGFQGERAFVIVEKPGSFVFQMTPDRKLELGLWATGQDLDDEPWWVATSSGVVPVGKWTMVAFEWSRYQVAPKGTPGLPLIWVDRIDRPARPLAPGVAPPEGLAVSPESLYLGSAFPGFAFHGVIDAVELQAIRAGEEGWRLEGGLTLSANVDRIVFDPQGRLDPNHHPEPVVITIRQGPATPGAGTGTGAGTGRSVARQEAEAADARQDQTSASEEEASDAPPVNPDGQRTIRVDLSGRIE